MTVPHSEPAKPKRLLLVEDDQDQAVLLRRWLEADNAYVVDHVSSGFEAAERLAQAAKWDIVVSDINIPGPDGVEVLKLVKDRLPRTPVLLVTAHADLDVAVRALRNNADDFLAKPLNRTALLEKLSALIRKADADQARDRRVVLAVGAHPDDVEIGIGGILLDHTAKGDVVIILTLTGGEAGGVASERTLESREAAHRIGASLEMRALPDTSVSEGAETISEIETVIKARNPDIIYTHTSNDTHQDHRAVHRATMVAARTVKNLFCYQAPSSNIDFRPNLFIDVGAQMDRKLEVLAVYATQTAKRPYLVPSLIRSTAEYWGRFANYAQVEPLEVVRSSL